MMERHLCIRLQMGREIVHPTFGSSKNLEGAFPKNLEGAPKNLEGVLEDLPSSNKKKKHAIAVQNADPKKPKIRVRKGPPSARVAARAKSPAGRERNFHKVETEIRRQEVG